MTYAFWFLAGAVLGTFYGLMQRWTVDRLEPTEAGQALLLVIGGGMLRLFVAGILLFFALQQGIVAALLAVVGLTLTRWLLLAAWNRRTDDVRG